MTLSLAEKERIRQEAKGRSDGFYIFFTDRLASQAKILRDLLPRSSKIHYSVKANPSREILSHLLPLVDGFDIASAAEFDLLESFSAPDKFLTFTGPAKSDQELERISRSGSRVISCVESVREASQLGNLGVREIVVRLNPGDQTHFGIPKSELEEFAGSLQRFPELKVVGYHTHSGSQILNETHIQRRLQEFLAFRQTFKAVFGREAKHLLFGAGFGIPLASQDQDIDLAKLRDAFAQVPSGFVIELGRFLVAPSGYFVTRVTDVRKINGTNFVFLDGGFTQFAAPTTLSWSLRGPPLPELISSQKITGSSRLYTLVGPSCYSQDILARNATLPELHSGDLVCFPQAGAYGATFSPQNFLLRPRPAEIFLKGKKAADD